MSHDAPPGEEQSRPLPHVLQWQVRLLPFVLRTMVVLAGFFLVATLVQLAMLEIWVSRAPDVRSAVQRISVDPAAKPDEWMLHARVALEAAVFDRRYHQAAAYLMARIWTRYLGFLTGMVLAIIGAVFVLAKLRAASKVEAGWPGVRAEIVTTSPGVVLATLGVVLMVVTVLVHHRIDLADYPLYVDRVGVPSTTDSETVPVLKPPSKDADTPGS